ncbi:unnamed protein product [Wuchereria bancrofti]|uniref:Uncharacterized protein n=1 Tax=Wuchereria bancrofti TaxID=6293 RepID=A0A3P7F316_WUCBA|nr:unnamed protein product [Wuchereria bancrofti]
MIPEAALWPAAELLEEASHGVTCTAHTSEQRIKNGSYGVRRPAALLGT